ncbi:putative FBD-associated F-box protein At5g56700 isoform X1 [Ziziphus jujuba]|uniref:FBD-associated F-box protein At5g56700 isoform X1 n=1 Tax=Ziziphus jujuba TaxID=326968 RepID=A0ABM3IBP7_ZIZJJ|nr:putative FBD-associated F-box protein At5g56700 isoform X1 [Ziziphus jujuba]
MSEFNRDDKISHLSDDILAKIICMLPLKEAAATSVLSQRWRYVWTSATDLNFEGEQLFHCLNSEFYSKDKLNRMRKTYINWVNSIINQHDEHNGGLIERLRIAFDLSHKSSSSLNGWIHFAMENGVQIIDLELLEGGGLRGISTPYTFPSNLEFNKFKSLKVFRSISIEVCQEVLESLLGNCPLLERLEVMDSYALTSLKVVGPSLPLKHLKLSHCFKMESLEICDALNLVSFYFKYPRIRLILRNVPKLVDVYLHSYKLHSTFTMLSCCVSQLHILQLFVPKRSIGEFDTFPMLTNLKELKLIFDEYDDHVIFYIPSVFKIAPNLKRLQLMLRWSKEVQGSIPKPENCPRHLCLEEVEITGYSSLPINDELILYLIEHAVSLDKIIVNPCIFEEWPFNQEIKTSETRVEEEHARRHARKNMQKKIPKTIEFMLL